MSQFYALLLAEIRKKRTKNLFFKKSNSQVIHNINPAIGRSRPS